MKVSELHQQRLFTAEADETLDEVADRMRWHAIAALPVFDASHNLVGIITERDLTAAVADDADPAATRVADYMTPAPAVLGPDCEFAEAAKTMLQLGVRHLPVIDKGHLVAVLSMRDVLDAETTATPEAIDGVW
jgi:CBS domain-containing protein